MTDVAAVTGAPEMLDGRVKTLHPRIAAGVLADLRDPAHRAQLAEQGIEPFGLVVVNLYRFEEAAARAGASDDELIEEIDIGGPTLVRAAAKNHASVGIVCDPDDYPAILAELAADGTLSDATRRALALKAFRLTAGVRRRHRCGAGRRVGPDGPAPGAAGRCPAARRSVLRYGENPHQAAALYTARRHRSSSDRTVRGRRRDSWPASRSRTTTSSTRPPRRRWRATSTGLRSRHRQARQPLRRGTRSRPCRRPGSARSRPTP